MVPLHVDVGSLSMDAVGATNDTPTGLAVVSHDTGDAHSDFNYFQSVTREIAILQVSWLVCYGWWWARVMT